MSSSLSSAAPTSSGSTCSTADFTQFPTSDIACAVGSTTGLPSNTSDTLSSCCKSAPVEEFNGNCGYYCLSVQQTVAELQACFMEGGVSPASIFCSGNNSASATGTPTRSGGSGATGTGAPGSSSSTGAGVIVSAPMGVSKAGLGMLGMVVASIIAGALL